jgi:palmitoyl transferase
MTAPQLFFLIRVHMLFNSSIGFTKQLSQFIAASAMVFGVPAICHAQQADDAGWWDQAKNKYNTIMDQGQTSLLLSGYAHHGRNTYTPERLHELNEKAWGMGFEKTMRDTKDNEEILYAMGISDSHFKPEFLAGYAYQWMLPLPGKLEAGAGYTVSLTSRADYFGGFPFPIVLPVASIGTKSTKLMASYVPRLSKHKGNGDVLLMFVRFDIN